MKFLTLWQPWASLIAIGAKTIETRSWSTDYRGPLAIHAAKRSVDHGDILGDFRVQDWDDTGPHLHAKHGIPGNCDVSRVDLPLGAVVAVCELVDVVSIGVGFPSIHEHVEGNVADLDHAREPKGLWNCTHDLIDGYWTSVCIEDQRPFGDFARGRFGWVLDNICPLSNPHPMTGARGLQPVRFDDFDAILAQLEVTSG